MTRAVRFSLLALAALSVSRPTQAQTARVLVMPFELVTRDARTVWLGEGTAVRVTDDLLAMGVDAIPRLERQQAFEQLQVPPAATLTDATVIRIGQLVGASQIVVGTLQLEGDVLSVRARAIDLEPGRVTSSVDERGPLQDFFATIDHVAARLAPSGSREASGKVGPEPTLAVFENYIKGLLAETPETAIGFLTTALKLQPDFDRARLALWVVYDDEGEDELALAAVEQVPRESPHARRAKFLAGLSQLYLKRLDAALATFKALAAVQTTPSVLNNLGVIQLRRGGAPGPDSPRYFFTKALEADPDDRDAVFNLGYACWMERDAQAAIYWLREAVRRTPTDGDAHFALGAALAAAGNGLEASRERELARRLSAVYEQRAKKPGGDTVPRGLERIKHDIELPHSQQIDRKLASNEQRSQEELAGVYLDSGKRQYALENDRLATDDLNRALYLSPYLAEAQLLLGRIHLRNGQLPQAIDAFKIALWSAETPDAHAALGEAYRQAKDLDAARAEAQRALAIDPESSEAKQLLNRLDGR